MAGENLELYDSEWAILEKVWELEPCAAGDVQEAVEAEKGWAYTTVKTMMDRMVKKGLLKARKIRNIYLYRSAVSKKQARSGEIRRTLKRAFDGAFTPMMQFMIENEELSDSEYKQLEKLIKARKISRSKK